jgi:uncharacterized membrane protein
MDVRLSRWLYGGALLAFALGALLRLALVEHQGLWIDEFFSLAIATGHSLEHPAERADPALGDFVERPQAVAPSEYARYLQHDAPPASRARVVRAASLSDTSPPAYYLVLHEWTRWLGTSDAVLRLFSVLWSLACFPLLASLARQLGGLEARLPTLLLFAVSPLGVFYSAEVRMYSMLLFASCAFVWLSLRLRQRGVGPWTLFAWITMGAFGLMIHYFFLFVWLSVLLWLQLYPGRLQRRFSWAGGLGVALAVLPWYLRLPERVAQWRVTGHWLERRPYDFDALDAALSLPWNFFSIRGMWTWGIGPYWEWINVAAFVALAAAVLSGSLRWLVRAPERQLLWLWMLAPCLGLVMFDALRGTYTVAIPRYALAGLPAALLLAAVALGRLPAVPRALLLGSIVLVWSVGTLPILRSSARGGEKFRELGRMLAQETDARHLVLVHSIPSGVTGTARSLVQHQAAPTGVGFAAWVGQLGRRRVPHDLERLAAGREVVVFVRVHDSRSPAPEQDWLEEHAQLEAEQKVGGIQVQYFVPRVGGVFFPASVSGLPTGGPVDPALGR